MKFRFIKDRADCLIVSYLDDLIVPARNVEEAVDNLKCVIEVSSQGLTSQLT